MIVTSRGQLLPEARVVLSAYAANNKITFLLVWSLWMRDLLQIDENYKVQVAHGLTLQEMLQAERARAALMTRNE